MLRKKIRFGFRTLRVELLDFIHSFNENKSNKKTSVRACKKTLLARFVTPGRDIHANRPQEKMKKLNDRAFPIFTKSSVAFRIR